MSMIPEIPMMELQINAWNPISTGFVTRQPTHVSITHLATGIYVESSDERSIHKARAVAMEKFEKAWVEYWGKPAMNNREAFEAWAEKELLPLDRRDSEHYRYNLTNRAWAGYQAALASQAQQEPLKNLEQIQFRNIKKVVKALADFCFSSPSDPTYGSCHVALTTSLTARDGIDISSIGLESLYSTPLPPAPEGDKE